MAKFTINDYVFLKKKSPILNTKIEANDIFQIVKVMKFDGTIVVLRHEKSKVLQYVPIRFMSNLFELVDSKTGEVRSE